MSSDSAHLDSMRDPATYRAPVRYCDIVMKGGITSGVIYPHAVCEIARTYQFRSIGGASAGAIAAVAAAAAEYGRPAPSGGFARFAELPRWMGESSNLYDLFQPQEGTRRLFRLFTSPIGVQKGRISRLLVTAMEQFFRWAIIGLAPGAVTLILGLLLAHGTAQGVWIGTSIPIIILGILIGVVFGIYRAAGKEIPANRFGLCSGMPGPSSDVPSLTPWLDRLIEDLAGRGAHDRSPLTFRDLWAGRDNVGKPPGDKTGEPCIRLEMMTTNLTQGRPYRLPFEDSEARQWYFDPREFRKLFPERIVRWMERHPPALALYDDREWTRLERKLLYPLRPMPDPADLPVVVAARMSLSFPLLMTAVPLWAVDWARTANEEAKKRWRPSAGDGHPETRFRAGTMAWDTLVKRVGPPPKAVPHWFSDGGITSNFPVHFFDAPIPRWPTFAINLRQYHPDYPPSCNRCADGACDQHQSIWMPNSNKGGILEEIRPFAPKGLAALVGFGHAIIDTMQNWTDNTQTRVPGYRDRVAHVYHDKDEGGMNLSMPSCRIEALAERGRCAAERLVEHFALPMATGTKLTWDNHRWVRYRTTMALLQETVTKFGRAWIGGAIPGFPLYPPPGEAPFDTMLSKGRRHAPSYQLDGLQPFARDATWDLLRLGAGWHVQDLADGAPRPRPELRIRPRL